MLNNWLLQGKRWIIGYIALGFMGIISALCLQKFLPGFDFHDFSVIVFSAIGIFYITPIMVFSLAGIAPLRLKAGSSGPANEAPPCRFLVIIPAFNEKEVIANSVTSMLQQRAGSPQARVIVAFNGTDETGSLAARLGAEVITTPEPGCGKTQAIAYVLTHIPSDPARYILVLDADNVVSDDFLAQLSRAAGSGTLALQANHQVRLSNHNWISLGLHAAYAASSRLFNPGRSRLINSALLCGTGFAIREDVFRALWGQIRTQTEDIELNGLLSLKYQSGVQWVEEARFFDEKPDTLVVAIRQRVRWMVGHLRCMQIYSIPLFVDFFRYRSVRALDLAFYYIVPVWILMSSLWMMLIWPASFMGLYPASGFDPDIRDQAGALVLCYIIGLPMAGYLMQLKSISVKKVWQGFLHSVYGALFATLVWPLAIVLATLMLHRRDWIFHTPHKSSAGSPCQ